ncbi:MAG: ABC transporter substrate-binding protein [Jaaginema sp. PMC 1079.18]|nr:ABC transporter substrate-binding protein [Jaaginema sp. PMC 1080.18]MEC4852290.1 ABC transporter substrate-binding protein [Jaaginema sp. PMC 1079.18]MEC4868502.1 ABC transporter substrate-binding protein [Jaaginema sp. PMC 1078.18]
MKITQFWRRILAAIALICTAISLTACNPAILESNAAEVQQVVMSILSDPKTFNAVLSAESPNIFGLTYEGLVEENPITGEFEPTIAESWEISDDGLEIVFTIRPNLKWSDGENLTVDDVVFTYNRLYLNEDIPSNARDSLRIGQSREFPTITKEGDREVKFTVPEPFAPFLGITALPILPAHALAKSVETKNSEGQPLFVTQWGIETPPEKIIFNGPYVLKSYRTSERLIFERNPYYWRKDAEGNSLPYIERVVWQVVESTDTALLQFRSGSLDTIAVSPEYFSLLKHQEEQGKFTIYNGGPAYGTSFFAFNLNTGIRSGKPLVDPIKSRWFNNVKFRQAVAYAIDRQRMINNIYRGLGQPQNSPISVQSPFYASELEGYDYDPKKAKELLAEAGFRYEGKRLVDSEGNAVRFSLITNAGNKIREAMATQIEQDLEAIGMQVDYSPIAFNVLVAKLTDSLDWECFLLGLTGGNEPNDGANVWFPEGNLHMFNQQPQAGRDEVTGQIVADWEKRMAELYIQAAKELDTEKRKEIYIETQRLTQEYLPFIYLVNPYSLSAVRDKIQKIQYSALGGPFWNIYELRLVDAQK